MQHDFDGASPMCWEDHREFHVRRGSTTHGNAEQFKRRSKTNHGHAEQFKRKYKHAQSNNSKNADRRELSHQSLNESIRFDNIIIIIYRIN